MFLRHFFAFCRDAVSLRHEEDNKSNKGLRNTVLSVSLDATFWRLCSSGTYLDAWDETLGAWNL
ncbi:hypothetical protein RhiirA4_453597 [Rhizophagus irregularis]|uniref:Uncharacterized protein n=1 Tax=Rhizophagus irregularis TaxID=588596 RepID=A0A2I1G0U4_9GLOM|nr:hypothetical protein RhiirA4_453597 [Rhizophagus irregularis]